MIGWWLGVLGIVAGVIGGVYFVRSALRLTGSLKESISYLAMAAAIYVIFSSLTVWFGLSGTPINNLEWQIVPVLFFFSAALFAKGASDLVKLLTRLEREKQQARKRAKK